MNQYHTSGEKEVASAAMPLKRSIEDSPKIVDLSDERAPKLLKRSEQNDDDEPRRRRSATPSSSSDDARSARSESTDDASTCDSAASFRRPLHPAPFFYYRDHSEEKDDDPLSPLTPPGHIPQFPAKMHAILSRADLRDVVAWQPHGRSWRILDARAFEKRVLSQYFQTFKASSFVRQANGWGFRRITRGRDRNCYYHELFLRGMPHLCKGMKRPGVAKKITGDPEHEPDLYRVSELHPVPEAAKADETVVLPCAVRRDGGPIARMAVPVGVARNSPPLVTPPATNTPSSSITSGAVKPPDGPPAARTAVPAGLVKFAPQLVAPPDAFTAQSSSVSSSSVTPTTTVSPSLPLSLPSRGAPPAAAVVSPSPLPASPQSPLPLPVNSLVMAIQAATAAAAAKQKAAEEAAALAAREARRAEVMQQLAVVVAQQQQQQQQQQAVPQALATNELQQTNIIEQVAAIVALQQQAVPKADAESFAAGFVAAQALIRGGNNPFAPSFPR